MKKQRTPLNIVLLCLDHTFCKSVARELSSRLGMFFSDCKDLIEYDLVDSQAVLANCGIVYLKERERSAIKNMLNFSSSVLSCDFDIFKHNRRCFTKKSLLVFLRLPQKCLDKKETINDIAFSSHEKYLLENADVSVELKSKSENMATKRIIEALREEL